MIALTTAIANIKGVPSRLVMRLQKLGVKTVRDLLWHFPTRYEDYTAIVPIADLEVGQFATVHGMVQNIKMRRTFRRHMVVVEAEVVDDTGTITAVWFNQPYIARMLPQGRLVSLAGKITYAEDRLQLGNPTYEVLRHEGETANHTGRLVPIYPETKGLTSKGIRYLVKPILANLEPLAEIIPDALLKVAGIPNIMSALRSVHFPSALDDAARAKKRFAFEDIFLLQLNNIKTRLELAKESAPALTMEVAELEAIVKKLPFELTPSQRQSLKEIIEDIGRVRPMNRLLQGDVGSGKTVIAALAAIVAAKSGYQAAFMAPTEVLARQHYKTLTSVFGYLNLPIGLITGSGAKIYFGENLETETTKQKLRGSIESGELKIVIGTHALIQKTVAMEKLGLAIVDEQHRFGVAERAAILGKQQKKAPHFLSMSATPIPRTLTLTVFGDLDLSVITELPQGRKPIMTKIVAPENRAKAYSFILQEIKKGRQAFVVCPRIEKVESVSAKNTTSLWSLGEVRAVEEEYERLSKEIFPTLRVAMLHGKLKPKEKAEIMADFGAHKIDILVSTSVIEVGVDIPNATIMMIEGAERFGLAQLYQFRGRVGRGAHQSFCLLFTEVATDTSKRRLQALIDAKNAFELAEKDLAIRGPGEFLGESQTGLPDIAMESLTDHELVRSARNGAIALMKEDHTLQKHPALRERFEMFKKKIHLE